MLHRLALAAALAAALALPLTLPFHGAATAQGVFKPCVGEFGNCVDDGDTLYGGRESTEIDLGIEVARVPLDRASVLAFLSTLNQRNQFVLVAACSHYLEQPNAVRSRNTLSFCRALLG